MASIEPLASFLPTFDSPLDDRLHVADHTELYALANRYRGMLVHQNDDDTIYVLKKINGSDINDNVNWVVF